jgi:HPt (histidine-containing phosphotransfer) domain-containing protein
MPKRPRVLELPQELRQWLDQALLANGFSNYEQLAAALAKHGHTIGKSSLQRYGSVLEKRLAALKVATDQAKAIVEASPDDEGSMNEALIRLTQERLFGVLLELEVDPETVNITKLTKSIADLARSSVTTKRFASEVRAKVSEKLKTVEAEAKKMTGSPEEVALAMLAKVRAVYEGAL